MARMALLTIGKRSGQSGSPVSRYWTNVWAIRSSSIRLESVSKASRFFSLASSILRRWSAVRISCAAHSTRSGVRRTSRAGARGLMQLTPATAHAIAQRTGGTAFTDADLATPQVNIAYGAWYLRHLLDHYGGNEVLALAGYNAGLGNVDRWLIRSGGGEMKVADLPFPETRAYVSKVLHARDQYRRHYRRELGL